MSNALPMAILGAFPFHLATAPFQELSRTNSQRWGRNDRVGRGPSYQHLGPADGTILLSGELRPEITAGPLSLAVLREMAASGLGWILLGGTGTYYGIYLIERLEEGQTDFMAGGQARRITFSLTLQKLDDARTDLLGSLTGAAGSLLL